MKNLWLLFTCFLLTLNAKNQSNIKENSFFGIQDLKESGKIILTTTISAITYAILHDQITARNCIEYFNAHLEGNGIIMNNHHKTVLDELGLGNVTSPTAIACIWGTLAGFPMGILLGSIHAACARLGKKNKLSCSKLMSQVIACIATIGAATLSYYLSYDKNNQNHNYYWFLPEEKKELGQRFLHNGETHNFAYSTAFIIGLASCIYTITQRL